MCYLSIDARSYTRECRNDVSRDTSKREMFLDFDPVLPNWPPDKTREPAAMALPRPAGSRPKPRQTLGPARDVVW